MSFGVDSAVLCGAYVRHADPHGARGVAAIGIEVATRRLCVPLYCRNVLLTTISPAPVCAGLGGDGERVGHLPAEDDPGQDRQGGVLLPQWYHAGGE